MTAGQSREVQRQCIDRALAESTETGGASCARCKVCDKQTDAVMAVLDAAGPSREALEALAAEWEAAAARSREYASVGPVNAALARERTRISERLRALLTEGGEQR